MMSTLQLLYLTKIFSLHAYIKGELIALSTQAKKAPYFLEYVIKPALDIDNTDNCGILLSVMEHCGHGHMEKLACEIESEIAKTSDSKSGMYRYMYVHTYMYIHTYVCIGMHSVNIRS